MHSMTRIPGWAQSSHLHANDNIPPNFKLTVTWLYLNGPEYHRMIQGLTKRCSYPIILLIAETGPAVVLLLTS